MNSSAKRRKIGLDHLKQLIRLAGVDGEVREETELIEKTAQAWGLSTADVARIRRNPGTIRERFPDNRLDRTHQLYDLIMICLCDGKISKDERHSAHARAKQIGFSHNDVDELIDILRDQVTKDLDQSN